MGGMSAVLARLVVLARHDENMPKCRRPKMLAPMAKCQLLKNVGFLLKMSALKKYSKSKNTSAYINVSAYKNRSASYNIK